MKKIKIMLLFMIVVATVAGALAFKVYSEEGKLYCGTTHDLCTTPNSSNYQLTIVPPFIPGVYCSDIPNTNTCFGVTYNE